MCHGPTIKDALLPPKDRNKLNPSIVFALLASSLREHNLASNRSLQSVYGSSVSNESIVTLVPQEANHFRAGSTFDLAERLKSEADSYLTQAIISADGALGSWLTIAQAALLLMQNEEELSPEYGRYLEIAEICFRSPSLQQALANEAELSTGNRFHLGPMQTLSTPDTCRSSVMIEEAARLRLLPLWVMSRVGVIYPNAEFVQTSFTAAEVEQAYVFGFWREQFVHFPGPDEEMANSARTRIIGLNVLYTVLKAIYLPYQLDYADADGALNSLLQVLDDADLIPGMIQDLGEMEKKPLTRLRTFGLAISVVHLHGHLIRRLGFAHCDNLRSRLSAQLAQKHHQSQDALPPVKMEFKSPSYEVWCDLIERFLVEFEWDTTVTADTTTLQSEIQQKIRLSPFQVQVVSRYVEVTESLRDGAINTLKLCGATNAATDPVIVRMSDLVRRLQNQIQRHPHRIKDIGTSRVSS